MMDKIHNGTSIMERSITGDRQRRVRALFVRLRLRVTFAVSLQKLRVV
jgi:hypothetical protein